MKKSQVTIYIIVGLVLIIAAGIGVYIFSQLRVPSEKLPPEKMPINLFVEQCIKKVADESIAESGIRGGFLNINEYQWDKVTLEMDPFNSELLSLYNGGLVLPYWYYQKSELDRINIPSLEKRYANDKSIQDQLEKHISQKLPECLDNFRVFKMQNISITASEKAATTVSFQDDETLIKVNYPLQITKPNGQESFSEFSVRLPVRYKSVYNLAKDIAQYELDWVFLEDTTTDFLATYSKTDSDYLPPIYGDAVIGDCANRIFWVEPDVEKNLKTMLASNIPYLHVADTKFDPIVIDSKTEPNKRNRAIRQGIYKGLIKDVSSDVSSSKKADIADIEVLFNYDESYPLQLNFGKNRGGVLEPSEFNINALFSQFCMFDYSFVYNLKYPVLISLMDKKSRTDNGEFLFQFPIQVVLKNNFPRLILYSEPEKFGEIHDKQCSQEQRLSSENSLKVTDTQNKPMHHALVYYQCGPSTITTFDPKTNNTNVQNFAKKCFIGMTEKGVLKTKFPLCTGGGILSIVKTGYLEKTEFIGPIDKEQSFEKEIKLDAVKDFKVQLQKYFVKGHSEEKIENPGMVLDHEGNVAQCNIYTEPRLLPLNENALVKITKLDEDKGILHGITVNYYRGNETNSVTLAPGKYQADITLLRNERYQDEQTIRKESETRTLPSSVPGTTKTISYPDKDIALPTIFSGGTVVEFEVNMADMNKDTIMFSVFDEGPPKRLEDVGRAVRDREGCSSLNPTIVKPVFK